MTRAAPRLLGLWIIATLASTVAARDPVPVAQFEPDVAEAGELELQGRTWTLDGPSYTIQLRPLAEGERLNFISHTTGLRVDPFAAPAGQTPRFIGFLLRIENRGEGDLQFNPIHSWLMTNRKKIESPLALSDLSFDYHVSGREFPPAYERVGPALLQHPRAIKPGEAVAGLLVYRMFEPKTKRYHVDVELTLPGGDGVSFSAPYRRRKAKSALRGDDDDQDR